MKPLNVLSIDFDFFQVVDADTIRNCYPDGIDLPTEISEIIWSTHYANPETAKRINAVKCGEASLRELETLIQKNHKPNFPAEIRNSHKHILPFIERHADKARPIRLVNVDMHHDLFNDNEGPDCGNWISHLTKSHPRTQVRWIANPISREAYGMDDTDFDMVHTDFRGIKDWNFDLLYLCRSDNWLPPHLDPRFHAFATYITSLTDNVVIEPGVSSPRKYQKFAKELLDKYGHLYYTKRNGT